MLTFRLLTFSRPSSGFSKFLLPKNGSFHTFALTTLKKHPSMLASCSTNWAQIVVRSVRTRAGSGEPHQQRDEKENEKESQEGERTENQEEEGSKQKQTIDPALLRKLRIYVLIVGCFSFGTSFFLLSQLWHEGSGLPKGVTNEHFTKPGIEFDTFVEKYLKAGEVKQIVFCPQQKRALVFLQEGAIIDRRIVSDPVVVVNYAHTAQQFWADVRKEESLMGISLHDGVKIDMYKGLTTFKVVEMLIGILIIAWLGTQYGRLLRKRFLENKAKQGKSL